MQEAYVNINGIRTKITTFGPWIEESIKPNENIVVVIPGNPGINSFYDVFSRKIHEKLGYPVWVVGHAGHNIPEQSIDPLPTESDVYGLKGQVQHKLDFLKKYIPESATIHLIGHSIGSYMILELLEDNFVQKKMSTTSLLFPTVEYMRETSNGIFMTSIVKHTVWLILFLSWIFTMLPGFIQNILLTVYCTIAKIPPHNKKSIIELINPELLSRVFSLAMEEMDEVRERNNEAIRNNVGKIRFLYGATDGWAPEKYYNKIVGDVVGVKAELSRGFNHAFVLRQSIPVAETVCNYIQSNN
ncbi:unnamed protein product [Brassicogethes aeneus]|uniref:Lipid droplet-associated hydrolase n=1 Tax=Brassicogethes aeneus TaxID=1431903 RepID=A0A9P0BHP8_BRAAE|nr:unnamed protein product [Brassicogethes aeneus]